MSKNVAVFVDVANIFYAAKAAGVDIDYVTLLKASSAGRDLVRAYAYTGLDPDNENQRNFHDFLRRHGYKVVSKDIRKYGDGKVKANLDIELVVDMMKTARNLDIAIVVSGDGDFAPAIRAVQEMGVRVEVVSFRGNTSSDLIEVADIFTDITQIAKVEKGSSRSGRRVATDDEDLSMTEVPDKLTEGTGDGRRRGRGSRSRTGEAPATRTTRVAASGRSAAGRAAASAAAAADAPSNGEAGLIVLPGEKLSRAARSTAASRAAASADEGPELDELGPEDELALGAAADAGTDGAEADVEAGVRPEGDALGEDGQRRRRRRRGGRGRGRGRAREGGEPLAASAAGTAEEREELDAEEVSDIAPAAAPRRAAFSFGSVWDSQLGVPPANTGRALSGPAPAAGLSDDEDLDEPEIPEYLLAERRQRDANRGGRGGRGGVRGGRGGAYAAAMDRERYGAGRGATPSRFAEPAPRRDFREPRDNRVGGQPNRQGAGNEPRFDRPARTEPRSTNGDPWSEVPPEIEAMLRAQLASGGGRAARTAAPAPRATSSPTTLPESTPPESAPPESAAAAAIESATAPTSSAASRAGRSTRSGGSRSSAAAPDGSVETGVAAPRSRRAGTGTAGRARASSSSSVTGSAGAESATAGDPSAPAPGKATRRRAPSKASATDSTGAAAAGIGEAATGTGDAAEGASTPKRRTLRKKADPSA